MSKIYTKKGDEGFSSLYSGERLPKCDPIFTSLRKNDELTSRIGMARSICKQECANGKMTKINYTYIDTILRDIQVDLQALNSDIATISGRYYENTRFGKLASVRTKNIETEIDYMTSKLPTLRNFILPGGTILSSQLHLCRTATREAEASLASESSEIKAYINRLSDLFFTLARFSCICDGPKRDKSYIYGFVLLGSILFYALR